MKKSTIIILFISFSTFNINAQEEKEKILSEKSKALTDCIYEKLPRLDVDDRHIIEEIMNDYVHDVANLLEKNSDTESDKFKLQYKILNKNLKDELRPSMINLTPGEKNINRTIHKNNKNIKKGNVHNGVELIKPKTLEILKELKYEVPNWSKKKKKRK